VGRSEVRSFLDGQTTMTLAVADGDGPWAADVYYVLRDRAFCFFSSPESRHAIALERAPRAAATVHGAASGWRDIRGVQMSGTVEAFTGGSAGPARQAYVEKFPFAGRLLDMMRGKVRFYRFVPERILWIDNSSGLGKRREVEF
jgi:uncharacterized protein YhbP (UPF0306 family)